MYKIIALISILVRSKLPNPYMHWISHPLYSDLFNIVIGGVILHVTAFILSGCSYYKGIDDPAKGSFGYLISYIVLTCIISMIGKLEVNYKIGIAIFMIIYFMLCLLVSNIFRKTEI